MEMDKAEPQSFSAEHGQSPLKHPTSDEPNTASDPKRIKRFHDASIEPDVESPAIASSMPFPEKVC